MQNYFVDGLNFKFPDDWVVSKYDEWSFYRNRFGKMRSGIKALDLLAVSPDGVAWLIEAKDYRMHRREKFSDLAEEVSQKIFDTLAAILPAKVNGDVAEETSVSTKVANAVNLRVVLHLEQPAKPSKMNPRTINLANIQLKLRKHLKPIDAHPRVVDMTDMRGLQWAVS